MTLVQQRVLVLLVVHGTWVGKRVEQRVVENTVASDSKQNSRVEGQEVVENTAASDSKQKLMLEDQEVVAHFESLPQHDSKHCQPMDSSEEVRSPHFVQQRNY